ncbi:IclR family transcriptional regulator [Sporolactobacillus shoreicorticis]|uniref:IclR family transcriptional regulator n=1 Tax=Sporolactobacillus shoreicorticis TaxID=1923877 RepID=A0ABW5S395_9BACL|nr:IclR family transcriptional regulator [Sporolactobacillus shoreicorticis]MCO7127130.1 IclR family transcriptional regulator [Sporolactobacillus shoreicorticis]
MIEWMDRFVKLMDQISDCPAAGIGIAELSRQTLISKGTLHRMLQSMMGYQLVVQDPESKKYMLGPKAMAWGSTFLQNRDPVGLLAQYCKQVGEETGLYAFICRFQSDEIFCTHTHQPSSIGNSFFVHVGQRMPVHAAAAAQIILAFQSDEVIDRLLNKEKLDALTPFTLTDTHDLRRKIHEARRVRVAYCEQELELGTAALSVPIFHSNDQALISMSLVGEYHYFDTNKEKLIRALQRVAEQASDHLSSMQALSSLF